MGFFDRLLGKKAEPSGGFDKRTWEVNNDTKRAANSWTYLEAIAAGVRAEDVKITPQPSTTKLRATVRGFPLEVEIGNTGELRESRLAIGDTNHPYLDIDFDPDATPSGPAIGTNVAVGSDDELEQFKTLPTELQSRIVQEMRRLRIQFLRSHTSEFDITMHDTPKVPLDPIAWLVDTITLAVDIIVARGQVPPGKESTVPRWERIKEPPPWVRTIAQSIASKVIGGKIVEKLGDADFEVCWTEDGVPARIRIDYQYNLLDLEVRADGVTGDIFLEYDEDVTPQEADEGDDPWSEEDVTVFFAKYLYLEDTPAVTKAHAALLHSLGPALLGELVKTLEKNKLGFYLDDQVASTDTIANNEPIKDGGAEAVRIAKLLARVAKALPRGAVPPGPDSVRCKSCHARYFGTTCVHCGQR
jgi:hypothetical protein